MARLYDRSTQCEWRDCKCPVPADVELHDGYEEVGIYCRQHGVQMLAKRQIEEAVELERRKVAARERYEREIAEIEKEKTG